MLWAVLFRILIADVLNQVLFAFMVYANGSGRPVLNSSAMLLGHTAAYFAVGIVVALGLERITHYLANPSAIDYLVGLIVGFLLIRIAFPRAKKHEQKRPDQSRPDFPLGLSSIVHRVLDRKHVLANLTPKEVAD